MVKGLICLYSSTASYYPSVHTLTNSTNPRDNRHNLLSRSLSVHGIQMIAIVASGTVTPTNVISIGLSISSVASKAFMVSYSIHGATFLFNFLSFTADIVNIFCVVSWVFLVPFESDTLYSDPLGEHDIYTTIFVWKEVIALGTVGCIYVMGLITFTNEIVFQEDDDSICMRIWWWGFMIFLMGLSVIPLAIGLEAFFWSALPLVLHEAHQK